MGIFGRKKEQLTTTEPAPDLEQRASVMDLMLQSGFVKLTDAVVVDGNSALSIPAFWRAVHLKAGRIATLPLHAYEGGKKLELQPLILEKPDPQEDLVTTLLQLLTSLILHGNAIAILGGWDELGYPTAIKPVDPTKVKWDNALGAYVIGDAAYDPASVMHIKGLTLAGEKFGMGCVEVCRRAIDATIRVEEYGRAWFRDNATPSGIIKMDKKPSQEEADAIKQRWMANQRGSREPIVLPAGVEFESISISPEDSQFLATKVHSLTDIANIVGIPGYFIGAQTGSNTYSNVEQEGLNLLKFYLNLELAAVERAFTAIMPDDIEAKFNIDAILRVDTATRTQTLVTATGGPIRTVNEARALENLEPIDGGDSVRNTPTGDSTTTE